MVIVCFCSQVEKDDDVILVYLCFLLFSVSQGGYHNPADMPMQNPKEQIAMWQQNTYMSDSGIHSGATTNAPSLTGKEEDMDAEWLEGQAQQGFNQAAFTSEQV